MDTTSSSGIKFGELKKEEHYKRLERNLKLAFVKQMESVKCMSEKEYGASPRWPSLSSINQDGLDTSYSNGAGSLQVSRIGSEVVSSSTNLRKMLPMHKSDYPVRPPMATSSVKKFPINDYDKDRAIMPPPSIKSIKLHNANRLSNFDTQCNRYKPHNNRTSFDTLDTSMQISSGTSNVACQEDIHSGTNSDAQETKRVRLFSRWRILLNDQGQLIIKGTLQCGKIARSKPVIQRLSTNKIQSIYKHIYILDGNIVDERNELPDYVRGKFHNGFPDDWENVYQLWRNYVTGGEPVTFRWPTPITDDDDDLHSEVTDYNYIKNNRMESKEQSHFSKSETHTLSSGYYSKVQSDCNQNVEKTLPENQNSNKKLEVSEHSSEMKDVQHGNENNTCGSNNTSSNCSYSHLKNASYLYEIIREDKIPIILSHIGSTNCSPQYIDKFIDLIDNLKYFLHNTPNLSNEAVQKPQLPSNNKIQGCKKCNTVESFLEETNPENHNDKVECTGKSNNVVKNKMCLEYPKETSSPKQIRINNLQTKAINSDDNEATDSSDSEAYMGIPNVSLDHLIQSKLPKHRYRDKKKSSKDRKNSSRDRKNSSRDRHNEKENLHFNQQVQQFKIQNDSSVSITEDEREKKVPIHSSKISMEQKRNLYLNKANVKINERVHQIPNEDVNQQIVPKIYRPELPEIPVITQQVYEKQKPVVKSCEKVNLNLKLKHSLENKLQYSDISILDDDVSVTTRKHPRLENKVPNSLNGKGEEKLTDDVMMHPFLTYDSEDFIDENEVHMQIQLPYNDANEIKKQIEVAEKQKKPSEVMEKNKTKSKKVQNNSLSKILENENDKREAEQKSLSSEKKRISSESKTSKAERFGSKENPKILTSWVPCVVYDDEIKKKCSLKFEGKLLNEAGHVLNRKFTTDSIRQRHSAKAVETVNNEFYLLAGDLNDTKHVVPKELLKQCRTGCPSKIKEFCEEWRLLMPVLEKPDTGKSENLHEVSIDIVSVPTSSRGRKILPPLNYWDGERLKSKSNSSNILYEPGKAKETDDPLKLLATNDEISKKNVKHEENQKNKTSTKTKLKWQISKPQEELKIAKKRIAQKLTYSSSSDTEKNEKLHSKDENKSRPSSKRKPSINSQSKSSKPSTSAESAPQNNRILRKRPKVDYKMNIDEFLDPNDVQFKTPKKKISSGLQWTYQKGEQCYDNILSDDQVSVHEITKIK